MQKTIVILVGVAVLSYVGWRVYKLFSVKRKPVNTYCSECSGCSVMRDMKKKSEEKF